MTSRNQAYYDAFAAGYDRHRDEPYHRLIDELEIEVMAPLVAGRRVLDVGTGTGVMFTRGGRLTGLAREVVGFDLSARMLSRARGRGLRVVQGSATALPFADASFDVVSSFKVFAHLDAPRVALGEMCRVVRPGGRVVVELYNPYSLRGLLRRMGPARSTSREFNEADVHTRYDTLEAFRGLVPPGVRVSATRGIRVLTPAAGLLALPALGPMLCALERRVSRIPLIGRWGGFLVVTLERA